MIQQTIYESASSTAKKVRIALKRAFPNFPAKHFSVKSHSYAGGSSITVSWEDYPLLDEVDKVVKYFEGATFDGMEDYKGNKSYEWEDGNHYCGADFIFTRQEFSDELQGKIVARFRETYGGGVELTPNLRQKIAKELQENPSSEGISEMEYYESVVAYLNKENKWYRHPQMKETLYLLSKYGHGNKLRVPDFIAQYEPYLISLNGLLTNFNYFSDSDLSGYTIEHKLDVRDIIEAIKEQPSRANDSLMAFHETRSVFISYFADYCIPVELTKRDTAIMESAKQAVIRQYPSLKQEIEAISRDYFIQHKRLTDEKQLVVMTNFVRELAAKWMAESNTQTFTEHDILRVQRLNKLLTPKYKVKVMTKGSGNAVHFIVCIPLSTTLMLHVTPFEVSVYKGEEEVKTLIQRADYEPFSCFERLGNKIKGVVDVPFDYAKGIEIAVDHAFDLRRKVDLT